MKKLGWAVLIVIGLALVASLAKQLGWMGKDRMDVEGDIEKMAGDLQLPAHFSVVGNMVNVAVKGLPEKCRTFEARVRAITEPPECLKVTCVDGSDVITQLISYAHSWSESGYFPDCAKKP